MDVKETLQAIGERLQTGATAKTVFGDAVTAGDRTVIPVARVRFGFGAGGSGDHGGGGGGGGGVRADPAGIIEISPAGTTFKAFPVPDYRRVAVALALGILVAKVFRKLAR
jgi:uncharacterized spore protein YtfJ